MQACTMKRHTNNASYIHVFHSDFNLDTCGKLIGGEIGARAPAPTLTEGGAEPPSFFKCATILFSMPYTIQRSLKLLSEGLRNTLRELKFQFSWRTPEHALRLPRWLFVLVFEVQVPPPPTLVDH